MSMFPGLPAQEPPTLEVDELVGDEKQQRRMSLSEEHAGFQQRQHGFTARLDPGVTLEEYLHWAKIERELEEIEYQAWKAGNHATTALGGLFKSLKGVMGKGGHDAGEIVPTAGDKFQHEKSGLGATSDDSSPTRPVAQSSRSELDAEWRAAARALRTASWGGVFYLITTDILGWAQAPYVFANDGYGLGIGMFLLFGIAAAASGWMIWKTFMALDSSRYPVMSYSDPFFRLYGSFWRNVVNVGQSLQMFLSVAVLQLGQTNVLAQLAADVDLCFTVCGVIVLIVAMASGYMRELKHISWFSNAAVWINITAFILTMVAAALYGPNVIAQVNGGILPKAWLKNPYPVTTSIAPPPSFLQPTDANLFAAEFNGINSAVYAFSGAILFVAFLAEMRHPADFWKSVFCAQAFITVVYIVFGAFCYAYYGQYAYSLVNQTIGQLGFSIVVNVLSLITGWLAIFMYFNVGLKTVYLEVGQELCGLPPITTKKGKILWWALGPVYWIIAFVVAMSVPQFSAFTNFVGGLFSLNFTYSLSGIMFVGLKIQQYAAQPGEGFDPATGQTTRLDSGLKRYVRGFIKGWKLTVPALVYSCAGLAASGMGTWAAILALKAAFGPGGTVLTSWGCTNPFYNGPGSNGLAGSGTGTS